MYSGLENWVGILKLVDGILEKCNIWGFGKEDSEDGYASATRHRSAPTILGATNGSALGVDER